MATITNYECDVCRAVQNTPEQFWTVGVVANTHNAQMPPSTSTHYAIHPIEVCRKCLEHLGIYPSKKTKAEPEYNPPNIEDLIKDLIQQGIDNNG